MLANYAVDSTLFPRCIDLIESVFPGIKTIAMSGMKYNACWDKISLPFIIEENGAVIAHLGVIPFNLMLNHKRCTIAALHGICVKDNFRGKGLFKQLMQEALEYIENNFEASLLFTDNPQLYTKYDFSVLPEYNFIINSFNISKTDSDLKVLSLDNENDLKAIKHLLSDHLPLSNQISLINETNMFLLDNLNKKIVYSESLNVLIVFEIIDNTLYINDIISQRQYPLSHIINLIHEDFSKIIVQFCPDKFPDLNYTPVLANPECNIMVSKNFKFDGVFFRYPEPYRC